MAGIFDQIWLLRGGPYDGTLLPVSPGVEILKLDDRRDSLKYDQPPRYGERRLRLRLPLRHPRHVYSRTEEKWEPLELGMHHCLEDARIAVYAGHDEDSQ